MPEKQTGDRLSAENVEVRMPTSSNGRHQASRQIPVGEHSTTYWPACQAATHRTSLLLSFSYRGDFTTCVSPLRALLHDPGKYEIGKSVTHLFRRQTARIFCLVAPQ